MCRHAADDFSKESKQVMRKLKLLRLVAYRKILQSSPLLTLRTMGASSPKVVGAGIAICPPGGLMSWGAAWSSQLLTGASLPSEGIVLLAALQIKNAFLSGYTMLSNLCSFSGHESLSSQSIAMLCRCTPTAISGTNGLQMSLLLICHGVRLNFWQGSIWKCSEESK